MLFLLVSKGVKGLAIALDGGEGSFGEPQIITMTMLDSYEMFSKSQLTCRLVD